MTRFQSASPRANAAFPPSLAWDELRSKSFRFDVKPGLYQLSVKADGSGFDWESLYEVLNKWDNRNVRTGPWDFSINHANTPLVPAFRVALDGRSLGLWFFQRISLKNLENREFQGRCAFWIREEGEHELTLTPFQENPLPWKDIRFEPDPEDSLDDRSWQLPTNCQSIARLRGELLPHDPPEFLRGPLEEVRKWCLEEAFAPSANNYIYPAAATFPALLLGRWRDDPALKAKGRKLLESVLDAPGWGNSNPDGYGHNGDKAGSACLSVLARAWHLLEPGETKLRECILECIRTRGRVFLDLLLLNRDYWGGSVLQDHGWVAIHQFAECALWMSRDLPEASEWTRYIIPRSYRAILAMPRDGVIPMSSYASPKNYVDPLIWLRELLIDAGEADLYKEHPFPEVIDFFYEVMDPVRRMSVVRFPGGDGSTAGGMGFYAQFLKGPKRERASALLKLMMESPFETYRTDVADVLLLARGEPEPAADFETRSPFRYFEDSGLVTFLDDSTAFTLRSGPWNGRHAWKHAPGPCDRMTTEIGAGHFVLTVNGEEVFNTPDTGYSIRTGLRSCLLIDGEGQRGDIGYPMSIPDYDFPTDRIVRAEGNPDGCHVELDLGETYDDALEVRSYRRKFLLRPGGLDITDSIQLAQPRSLSWLFQTTQERFLAIEDAGVRLKAGRSKVCLTTDSPLARPHPRLIPSPVVYSYSARKDKLQFAHARFDTTKPTNEITILFHISWQ